MKVLRADWVCPVSRSPIRNGTVVIDKGKILEVGEKPSPDLPVVSFDGCAILPGLVNTHTHLELTVLRGFLENLRFPEWIRQLTRTKYEFLSREDLLVSARLGALESLQAGITTLGEVMDVGTGWEAMKEFGLRGVAYQEVFGPSEKAAAEAVRGLREKIDRLRPDETTTCRLGVSPHAAYTVSAELYTRVRDLAASENLPIAVHVAESDEESRFVRNGDGPFAEYWESRDIPVVPRGTGPIGYLDSLGLLGPGTLAIHAIDAGPEDIARLKERRSGIAHCPKSNLKLGHNIAPVHEFLAAGIPVGLGTDSVASNNVIDMFEEMRTTAFLQRSRLRDSTRVSAKQALRMATLDGARCLGLESHVGSIEPGKLADLIVVDLTDPALQPVYDPIEAIVYSANRKNVVATFLGGEQVRVDPRAIVAEARAIATRLRNQL